MNQDPDGSSHRRRKLPGESLCSEPGLFSANKTLFLPRHALFGPSQRAKWAKPWTASSLGPLSHSCPGLALGTGPDLSLWTSAITTKKKMVPPCRPACLRELQGCKIGLEQGTFCGCLHIWENKPFMFASASNLVWAERMPVDHKAK